MQIAYKSNRVLLRRSPCGCAQQCCGMGNQNWIETARSQALQGFPRTTRVLGAAPSQTHFESHTRDILIKFAYHNDEAKVLRRRRGAFTLRPAAHMPLSVIGVPLNLQGVLATPLPIIKGFTKGTAAWCSQGCLT